MLKFWQFASRHNSISASNKDFFIQFKRNIHRSLCLNFKYGQQASLLNKKNSTVMFIQEVINDRILSPSEDAGKYQERCFKDICTRIPAELKSKPRITMHLLQTVDYSPTGLEKIGYDHDYIFPGHIMGCLSEITDMVTIIDGSVISKRPTKVPKNLYETLTSRFDTKEEFRSRFATLQTRYEEYDSRNFLVFIDLEATILTKKQILENIRQIKNKAEPFQLSNSACSQTAVQAFGLPTWPNMTTQEALLQIIKILKEPLLQLKAEKLFKTIGISLKPYDIWKEYNKVQSKIKLNKALPSTKPGGI